MCLQCALRQWCFGSLAQLEKVTPVMQPVTPSCGPSVLILAMAQALQSSWLWETVRDSATVTTLLVSLGSVVAETFPAGDVVIGRC